MNKYMAEVFGTFWLVLGGCGSAVLAAGFPDVALACWAFLWRSVLPYLQWHLLLAISQVVT